ncbi:MAG TPA: sterol desaturase family protein [Pseudomonadales bacterium]|nr:sterol desaturase family protein [Pseudomonadales bacterium]
MPTTSNHLSVWQRLFTAEMEIGETYRWAATAYVIVFAVTYALLFPGFLQYVAYLGPGLGDDWSLGPFMAVFNGVRAYAGGDWLHPVLLGFMLLWAAYVMFTGTIIYISYSLYPRHVGKPFPVNMVFTYFFLTMICTAGLGLAYLLMGLLAPLAGYSVADGLQAFGSLLNHIRSWADHSVPTLVDMPAWLAFFMVNMVGGFFHYWFHRLSHERRALWLLFHRPHHMNPELIQSVNQPVFSPLPFFFVAAIPYVLVFSVISKLITSESIVAYLIVYKLFSTFANMWSHQTALYEWAQGKWIIRALSTITSEGVYHYLHHSAEKQHNNPRGNLINIGGGLFFFWDRVFGTYVPVTEHRPRVGLQGIEADAMTTNPLRLAFSGLAQMLYELKRNPWRDWPMILFGTTDYVPKHSKEYVLKASLQGRQS